MVRTLAQSPQVQDYYHRLLTTARYIRILNHTASLDLSTSLQPDDCECESNKDADLQLLSIAHRSSASIPLLHNCIYVAPDWNIIAGTRESMDHF